MMQELVDQKRAEAFDAGVSELIKIAKILYVKRPEMTVTSALQEVLNAVARNPGTEKLVELLMMGKPGPEPSVEEAGEMGQKACEDGKLVTDNPFKYGGLAWQGWDYGYNRELARKVGK